MDEKSEQQLPVVLHVSRQLQIAPSPPQPICAQVSGNAVVLSVVVAVVVVVVVRVVVVVGVVVDIVVVVVVVVVSVVVVVVVVVSTHTVW